MIELYRNQGRSAAVAVIFSLLVATSVPADAGPYRRAGVIATTVAACTLVFASFVPNMMGPTIQAPSAEPTAIVKVEPGLSGQRLAEVRKQMDTKVTAADLQQLKKEVQAEMNRGTADQTKVAGKLDSHAKTFIENVFQNPKYQYVGLSLVAGELLIGGMLWSRMRLNVRTFERRLKTAGSVDGNMAPHFLRYEKAEAALLRAMRSRDGEDRAELLKQIESFPEPTRKLWETLLAPADPATIKPEDPSVDAAWAELEAAYHAVQQAGTIEARVMAAAGPREVAAPQSLEEIKKATEGVLRNLKGLDLTMEQITNFKNEIKHLDLQAKSDLGQDLKLRQKIWRNSRTGLLLVALPVIVLALNQMFDNQDAANRRIEDLNVASIQDREKAIRSLIPNMHRPILWTVVSVWKDEPRLRPYQCPVKVAPYEVDNPDLQVMQALVFRTILELGADPSAGNDFKFDEKFFEKLFPKIFALNPALAGADEKLRQDLIKDLSYRAVRAFDEIITKPSAPPAFGGQPSGDRPFGLNR